MTNLTEFIEFQVSLADIFFMKCRSAEKQWQIYTVMLLIECYRVVCDLKVSSCQIVVCDVEYTAVHIWNL